ncbi:MAG: (E)-4-hydroxy-3-methylbut-2-enyl-diphosphate synthase [Crocinitomicaceae bacterium]|nr:(E)-4-hydroxy-3-methylbut-2-enyl-diphosphate synthase [Crocinitomicaceae bacterium]
MIRFIETQPYCVDLFERKRLKTLEVTIGKLNLGNDNPIRVQSMTTTDTLDIDGSVNQSIRMIESGCELVRLTAPSKKEAEALAEIKEKLKELGFTTPLVADIHFTPNAAEIAAKIVEKVRVNPGNYADKKKFEEIDFTDQSYAEELSRIETKFIPLIELCKKHNTAMRIGTNHGSLSDRILSRYGDTPEGMVESAMEFIRICEKNDFYNIVISMKASNTLVMVQAYRLLCATMIKNGRVYPLHLGVTEAGDGEDGRIKSAVGIGALLEDGIGDTIRVSLTEEPEMEIPVAQKLIQKFDNITLESAQPTQQKLPYSPFEYNKRFSLSIHNIGGKNVPVVIGDLSTIKTIKPAHLFGFGYSYSVPLDKWNMMDQAADYVYIGENSIAFEVPGTLGVICDYSNWNNTYREKPGFYPLLKSEQLAVLNKETKAFILIHEKDEIDFTLLKNYTNCTLILSGEINQLMKLSRKYHLLFAKNEISNPIILQLTTVIDEEEKFQLYTSSEVGISFIDGFGDGIWLTGNVPTQLINSTSFGILQATRTRISKTEYISCPSCGRTLFDLQETTAKIRKETSHLKGIKIGIMGCIVNGPGEMADADYGYVGTGIGKIHLYKEKTVVKKNVPEAEAVAELINLIKENGDWIEPKL